MDWHIHHCGDSVSEGGSQARESKRREREREMKGERERRQGKKRQGGCDASQKLGQIHFQSVIATR